MGLLAKHARRWGTFCCCIVDHALVLDVLTSLNGLDAPNLESLRISDTSGEGDSPGEVARGRTYSLFHGPSSTPRLRALDSRGLRPDRASHPFANLIHLEMGLLPDGKQ